MKPATKIVIGLLPIMLLVVLGALVLPLRAANDNATFRSQLAITLAFTLLHVGGAVLFMVSLKSYKAKMRRAFLLVASGILVTALGTVQLPVANVFGLTGSLWYKSGVVIVPFLFGGLAIYAGIRGFAQLVDTRTVLTKARVVIPAIIVLSALSILLPHVASHTSALQLGGAKAILAWTLLLDSVSCLILVRIIGRIGAHYIGAMTWLCIALTGSVIAAIIIFILALSSSAGVNQGNTYSDIVIFFVGMTYLRAGYVFTQTEDY